MLCLNIMWRYREHTSPKAEPIHVNKTLATIALFLTTATVMLPAAVNAGTRTTGHASWYAMTSRTANGERADPKAMTAAHPSLPFGTWVRVKNLRNGRSVVVRINDRGPFKRGRIIDVSKAAAAQLGFMRAGITRVRIYRLAKKRK